MIEPFKIIPKFNNQFSATSEGKIYDTQNECFLRPHISGGRYHVTLKGHGRYKVHILVAFAYHGEPPFENCHVHHDNGNPLDNTPENLVYLTRSAHMELHAKYDRKRIDQVKSLAKLPRTEKQLKAVRENGKKTCAANNIKYKSKAVSQYALNGEFVATYPSMCEASRRTGVEASNISACCGGKLKTAGGFKWQHASPQIES